MRKRRKKGGAITNDPNIYRQATLEVTGSSKKTNRSSSKRNETEKYGERKTEGREMESPEKVHFAWRDAGIHSIISLSQHIHP